MSQQHFFFFLFNIGFIHCFFVKYFSKKFQEWQLQHLQAKFGMYTQIDGQILFYFKRSIVIKNITQYLLSDSTTISAPTPCLDCSRHVRVMSAHATLKCLSILVPSMFANFKAAAAKQQLNLLCNVKCQHWCIWLCYKISMARSVWLSMSVPVVVLSVDRCALSDQSRGRG